MIRLGFGGENLVAIAGLGGDVHGDVHGHVRNRASGQGCISCGILLSGTGARGVSSEHMENVEMFSENCALVWLSENRDLVLGEPCSGPQRTVLWLSENRALVLGETCSGSRRKCSYGDVCCRKWPYSCSGPILLYPTYPILSLFQTRFYQTDDSKVTRRLLKEKSKLTFVDV